MYQVKSRWGISQFGETELRSHAMFAEVSRQHCWSQVTNLLPMFLFPDVFAKNNRWVSKEFHFQSTIGLSSIPFWNIVVQYLGSDWLWSSKCPILLDAIGSSVTWNPQKKFHLLWNIRVLDYLWPLRKSWDLWQFLRDKKSTIISGESNPAPLSSLQLLPLFLRTCKASRCWT